MCLGGIEMKLLSVVLGVALAQVGPPVKIPMMYGPVKLTRRGRAGCVSGIAGSSS